MPPSGSSTGAGLFSAPLSCLAIGGGLSPAGLGGLHSGLLPEALSAFQENKRGSCRPWESQNISLTHSSKSQGQPRLNRWPSSSASCWGQQQMLTKGHDTDGRAALLQAAARASSTYEANTDKHVYTWFCLTELSFFLKTIF